MKEKKQRKDDLLRNEENYNIRTLVGQLGWKTGQTRPDWAFEVCQLGSILNRSKVDNILKASKRLKTKNKGVLLRFGLPGPIEGFKIVF